MLTTDLGAYKWVSCPGNTGYYVFTQQQFPFTYTIVCIRLLSTTGILQKKGTYRISVVLQGVDPLQTKRYEVTLPGFTQGMGLSFITKMYTSSPELI